MWTSCFSHHFAEASALWSLLIESRQIRKHLQRDNRKDKTPSECFSLNEEQKNSLLSPLVGLRKETGLNVLFTESYMVKKIEAFS